MSAARRVVIVGAGVTGLLAAVACVRAGYRVCVLERGTIPDPRAGSFDQHRAIRVLATGDQAGMRQMAAAHRHWLELETLFGHRFYRRVGALTCWPPGRAGAVLAAAAAAGLPASTVEPEKLTHLGVPAGMVAVLESDAGVLLAERALRAATAWLVGRATLVAHSPVSAQDIHGGRLDADAVLVAAGAWTAGLLGRTVDRYRQTVLYLRPPADLATYWTHAPAAGGLGTDGRGWLLPPGGGALLKISSDAVCRPVRPDGETDGAETTGPIGAERVRRLLAAAVVSDVDRYRVVTARECTYAAAQDGLLLERPGRALWSRSAPGGRGFGSAPLAAERFVQEITEEAA